MSEAQRKYLSEFAVSLFTSGWLAAPSDQLASDGEMPPAEKSISEQCHIYLICRKPSFAYDSNTFSFDGKSVSGHLIYKVRGEQRRIAFETPFELYDGGKSVKLAPYPHREFETFDANGGPVRYYPAYMMLRTLEVSGAVIPNELRSYQVLYVGQAYADGRRNAFDRIKSHATMQRILADTHYQFPDDQIWILAFVYEPYITMMMFDGRSTSAIRGPEDDARFVDIQKNPLSKREQICLAEAGLIRYFQPPYNKIYRDSFPSSDLGVLRGCYERDFSGLAVEIDTSELGWSLYSESVRPSDHHLAKFDLFEKDERLSFFAMNADSRHPDVIGPAG